MEDKMKGKKTHTHTDLKRKQKDSVKIVKL